MTDFIDVDGLPFTFAEIHSVVDTFYTKVQSHEKLKVPFASVHDWPHHIERLTHFWWIRLGGKPYQKGMYNPVEKHFIAGFNQELLTAWLSLFEQTLRETLAEEKATFWLEMATRTGQALTVKNELYRSHLASQE